MLRDLARAYARLNRTGMAALVTAERYALAGQLDDPGIHARRAADLLPDGSGPWQRAQDVLIAAECHARQQKEPLMLSALIAPLLALMLGRTGALPAAALDLDAMSDDERAAFGQAVRDYLMENPEVIMEAVQLLEQR